MICNFLKELFFVLFLRTYTQETQNIQLIISKYINKQYIYFIKAATKTLHDLNDFSTQQVNFVYTKVNFQTCLNNPNRKHNTHLLLAAMTSHPSEIGFSTIPLELHDSM